MRISSNDVRDQAFAIVRKGYDPEAVDAFLDEVGLALDEAYDLADATPAAEETVRLATDAAVEAKDTLLAEAKEEIGRIHKTAATTAERLVRSAEDEAQSVMIDARRDALALMERSRAEADALVTEARIEASALEERLVELRVVVQRTENLLKGMASGALGDVAKASTMLSTIEDLGNEPLQIRYSDGKAFNVDLQADEDTADDPEQDSGLPASVDALLEQLRDIS